MKIIRKRIAPFPLWKDTLHYDPDKSLFFDIETTGLSRSSQLYLIGAICLEYTDWILYQYLAETPAEEADILSAFLELSAPYQTLIHFNGTTFDLPFLTRKCEKYHFTDTLSEKESLDLYRLFRPLKKLLELEHMNQPTLQSFLGLKRKDTLDGKALIPVYQKYCSGKAPELSVPLLLHNEEDLLGMTQLLPISAYLELLQGNVHLKSCQITYSAEHIDTQTCSQGNYDAADSQGNTVSDDTTFIIKFQLEYPLPQKIQYLIQNTYLLEAEGVHGSLSIPAQERTLLYFFPDYRNYCYLPLEDQAIHKSVASFVDKEHRQPAKPSNCYTRKSGIFIPQPEECIQPSFRETYESKQRYFEYTDKLADTPELFLTYIQCVLHSY